MNLEDYLWSKKLRPTQFASEHDLTYQTVLNIVHRRQSPRLHTALLIHNITEGIVSLTDMLTEKDALELAEVLKGLKKN